MKKWIIQRREEIRKTLDQLSFTSINELFDAVIEVHVSRIIKDSGISFCFRPLYIYQSRQGIEIFFPGTPVFEVEVPGMGGVDPIEHPGLTDGSHFKISSLTFSPSLGWQLWYGVLDNPQYSGSFGNAELIVIVNKR